ncbi:hypothetical protein LLE49_20210 [Alicyclobacillus tolerans]|uniref:hypothetical protein n=1 Tax=Alicyclobacillus tolerans TaxID=90970 RepID=UPI001F26092F|nr:hypothetical protein [Alicyclobacillus tolerans]MCF8567049.1 hypothetical protein [Alicyclobacillus tolerans]
MRHKRKVWAIASGALALIVGGVFASEVFAYTVNNDLSAYGEIVKQYGSYTLLGGDNVKVSSDNPGPYPNLAGQTIHIAEEQANVYNGSGTPDGKGNWGLMHADMVGADAKNGYLLIAEPSESTNVQSWVQRLGGNLSYVTNYLQTHNQQIQTTDQANNGSYTYDPFATVVTQSGAKFGTMTATLTGQTYQGNPVYLFTYPIYTSAPPTVSGLTVVDSNGQQNVVTQGDPITFQSNVNVPLWSGIAGYHYDAVQIKDNTTGQTQWVVTGNGSYTINGINMQPVQGGHGTFTNEQLSPNSSFSTSSLTVGDTYTATEYVADGVHRMTKTPATTTFTVVSGTTPPPPPPSTGGTPTITMTANPATTASGSSSTISYTVSNWSSGDYVTVSGGGGKHMWSAADDTNATDSYNETENPQYGATTTVNYIATVYNSSGVAQSTAKVTATWTSSIPATTSLTLTAKPTSLGVGSPTTLTVVVPPNPTGGAAPGGEFLEIINQATGQAVAPGAYTGTSDFTLGDNSQGQTETYTTTYTSNTAGPQTFVAQLWDPNVTPYNHPPNLTSNTQTVTWIQPTITLSASPTNPLSGQSSKLSYSTTGMTSGDYATITGMGGTDMWSETQDTQTSGAFTETENPVDGGTTSVQYIAHLYDSSGTLLSTATMTVTWTAPTITMTANPTKNVPGQPSTISYSVNVPLPSGYTVKITPTGNGAHMWNASGLTTQTGTDRETENPAAGQTIQINYTAEIMNPARQAIAMATTQVQWVNAWTGSLSLTASPMYLPVDNSTTLTATGSTAIPSGYSLYIKDLSTGQIVANTGASPATTTYTSYSPETDQFQAYVYDGYEQVGNPSNAVKVVWSSLSLNATPTLLPVNHSTTLTVSGTNVPSGDFLVIYDQSTGQVVGYSQSTPYSVTQTESTPQTDQYVAYINTSATPTGAYATSNTVPVDWYSVTLTANPTRLPVNDTSTLTANAQNMPSGYVLDIVDQTSNEIVASGQPGQTMVQALQTRTKVEKDTYIAQVVQPTNPPIPGMTVPPSTPPDGLFSVTSTEVQHYDPATNTFGNIAGLPITVGSTVVSRQVV